VDRTIGTYILVRVMYTVLQTTVVESCIFESSDIIMTITLITNNNCIEHTVGTHVRIIYLETGRSQLILNGLNVNT